MPFVFNPLSGQFDQTGAGSTVPTGYTVVSTAQTIPSGAKIAADTSASAFSLTLPSSPTAGDTIAIYDYAGTFGTNALTLARNGNNIESLAEDLACNVNGAAFDLIYGGATIGWHVQPQAAAPINNVAVNNQNNNFTAGQTITAPANTSALTASYSVTGANTTPVVDLSGTWNTTGIARGIRLNITDTASNASSLLLDLQRNGVTAFSVGKFGGVTTPQYACSSTSPTASGFIWGTGEGLTREASDTLAIKRGTAAQSLRLFGTYSDTNNGRYLNLASTTAGVFTLTATGNGTGASGNVLKLTAPVLIPSASVTLATNGDLAFEATSNTTLTIRYRGSDGTTRSAAITLA